MPRWSAGPFFSLDDRGGAAQLALCLLVFALILAVLEQVQRGVARNHGDGKGEDRPESAHLTGWRARGAFLFCAFPVFFGFYSQRYQSYQAIIGILSGIVAGLFFFPLPGEAALHLYEAFLLATFVPVVVSLVLLLLPVSKRFEFSTVAKQTELLFSGK